jgi:hypothetical protein
VKRGEVLLLWKKYEGFIGGPDMDYLGIEMVRFWDFLQEFEALRERETKQEAHRMREELEARFRSYLPPEVEPEMHQPWCQKKRFSPKHACTCRMGERRRMRQLENSARADDREFLATLGSHEQARWHQLRKRFDPDHRSPYSQGEF